MDIKKLKVEYGVFCIRQLCLDLEDAIDDEYISFEEFCKQRIELNNTIK